MRNRYTFDTYHSAQTSQKSGSPTNSYENVISDQIMASQAEGNNKANQIFVDTPFASYKGHTSDLLDVSWSKVRKKKHFFKFTDWPRRLKIANTNLNCRKAARISSTEALTTKALLPSLKQEISFNNFSHTS